MSQTTRVLLFRLLYTLLAIVGIVLVFLQHYVFGIIAIAASTLVYLLVLYPTRRQEIERRRHQEQ
ncbi:hypothetical protein [Corynebacterium pelargi]|uniref:Uncharacterized protein n=1 Tax=Corynebacterium pelargi TaxID=1471400 RepID=A0A410W5K3_9CORY|nr:hypothetical protein [Corynebacterium pelargi]QAU51321.1 hypothetical protein CPELA_00080 [Corynebacterium pelargi]GGG81755.1 hypothetical protein GCM10007338_20650 [Corynebacterium pelargi]